MTAEKINKLSAVFGTSRDIPLSYVQRTGVDDRFLNDITRDKHMVIHGSSKQGKTSLRRYHLEDSDVVLIQGTRDATKASLYEMLLKNAGIKCEVSESITLGGSRKLRATLIAKGKVPFLVAAGAEGVYENDKFTEHLKEQRDFYIDPDDANDIVRLLNESGFKKFVVLEDFHYLDEDVQQSIAFDLKLFHETSKIVFIIVGVWLETNKLTLFNGDLIGRVSTINADNWKQHELLMVIEAGEHLLSISIPSDVKNAIIEGSQGNVGLLQEACYRLCEKNIVLQTQSENKVIGTVEEVKGILREVADEQSARYRNFLSKFSEGLGETQLEMYKWIAYVVVSATTDEIRRGLNPKVIFSRIRAKHPSANTLQHNNVLQALERVGNVQFKHKLQPLIFDFSNNALIVVDANLILFINTHTAQELQEILGLQLA